MSSLQPLPDPSVPGTAIALSLDLLLSNLPGAAYRCHCDREWSMEFISDGIEALTGYSAAAFTALPALAFASLILDEDLAQTYAAVATALSSGTPFQVTYRIRTADGQLRWICEQGAPSMADGAPVMLEGFLSDFTRLKQADQLVREQASFLQRARDAIIAMDMQSTISHWNHGAERLYGWSAQEMLGKRFCDLLCAKHELYEAAFAHTLTEGEWTGELAHLRRDGSTVDTDTRWTLLAADSALGASQKILVIGTDISERKLNEARIFRLAFFDHLTDLPNRANLLDHLRRALIGSARTRKCGALMFCDLDNFKYLNDSQGHAAGDVLLQARWRAASRAACARPTWWRAWAATSSWC